jgi:hypothetical protein
MTDRQTHKYKHTFLTAVVGGLSLRPEAFQDVKVGPCPWSSAMWGMSGRRSVVQTSILISFGLLLKDPAHRDPIMQSGKRVYVVK